MNDLDILRDHARDMAAWKPPTRPQHQMSATCYRYHAYGPCQRPPQRCCCACHDQIGPTPRQRALWQQIADEIEAYLDRDDEEQEELPI